MKLLDKGSVAVAGVTLVLFAAALWEKGFTHDVLLEAGVFLVSVKLMIMMRKNEAVSERLDAKLDAIAAGLKTQGE